MVKKLCAQCKKKPAVTHGFCSEECRDEYWPQRKKESLKDRLKALNEIKSRGRKNLVRITLKCGVEVWADWDSKSKCDCGETIWWATTDKNKRQMPIYKVEEGVFDTHFANCLFAEEKRMKESKNYKVALVVKDKKNKDRKYFVGKLIDDILYREFSFSKAVLWQTKELSIDKRAFDFVKDKIKKIIFTDTIKGKSFEIGIRKFKNHMRLGDYGAEKQYYIKKDLLKKISPVTTPYIKREIIIKEQKK